MPHSSSSNKQYVSLRPPVAHLYLILLYDTISHPGWVQPGSAEYRKASWVRYGKIRWFAKEHIETPNLWDKSKGIRCHHCHRQALRYIFVTNPARVQSQTFTRVNVNRISQDLSEAAGLDSQWSIVRREASHTNTELLLPFSQKLSLHRGTFLYNPSSQWRKCKHVCIGRDQAHAFLIPQSTA